MLRFLAFRIVLSAALIPFMSQIAQTRPPSEASQYPTVPPSSLDKPVCYMQTDDDRTLDLSSMCKKPPVKPNSNSQQNQIDIPPPGSEDLPEDASPL